MKNFKLYSVLAVALVLMTGAAANAQVGAGADEVICPPPGTAPNIFGLTGLLEMPTDATLAPGQVSLGYTFGWESLGSQDVNFFRGVIGVLRGLELGVGFVDPDESDTGTLINAKWRFVTESGSIPSVSVGVVDALSDLDIEDDNPGFYLLISKTLTGNAGLPLTEDTQQVRGHIGFGTGIYDGFMVGLEWWYKLKWELAFEFVDGGLNNSDFNAMARYWFNPQFEGNIGTIDFSGLTFGVSYITKRF